MIRRAGKLAVAAALLSPLLAACASSQQANCGVDGVRPHPEIGGQILYTCYGLSGGHGGLFLLDIASGRVRALTTDRARNVDGSWSPDGHLIVYQSTRDGRTALYVMDLANGGRVRGLINGGGFNDGPSWSPDGAWIAFQSSRDGVSAPLGPGGIYRDLYLVRPDGTDLRRVTTRPGFNGDPAWEPAGTRIAFCSDRDGAFNIFTMTPHGGDQAQLTFYRGGGFAAYPRWSPDGLHLVVDASNPGPGAASSIYTIPSNGGAPYRVTDAFDLRPDWSPDGRWIAYLRMVQGHAELFVVRPDGSDVTQLTSDGAGKDWPRWRPA